MANDLQSWVWMNDRLLPRDQAAIAITDNGLLVGDGVFETLVARGGLVFAEREHWQRLVRSCEALGLAPPAWPVFQQWIATVLQENCLSEARIRVTLTSGSGALASRSADAGGTVLVTAAALAQWPATAQVALCPWIRHPAAALAGVKSVSYGENVRALVWAKTRHCDEALFANNEGALCEGATSNVFLASGDRLVTPPLSAGCLAGVTRALVLQACAEAGLTYVEETIPATILSDTPEAFLTSTTRGIQPISELDGRRLADAPGPLTLAARDAFANLVRRRGGR